MLRVAFLHDASLHELLLGRLLLVFQTVTQESVLELDLTGSGKAEALGCATV